MRGVTKPSNFLVFLFRSGESLVSNLLSAARMSEFVYALNVWLKMRLNISSAFNECYYLWFVLLYVGRSYAYFCIPWSWLPIWWQLLAAIWETTVVQLLTWILLFSAESFAGIIRRFGAKVDSRLKLIRLLSFSDIYIWEHYEINIDAQ